MRKSPSHHAPVITAEATPAAHGHRHLGQVFALELSVGQRVSNRAKTCAIRATALHQSTPLWIEQSPVQQRLRLCSMRADFGDTQKACIHSQCPLEGIFAQHSSAGRCPRVGPVQRFMMRLEGSRVAREDGWAMAVPLY